MRNKAYAPLLIVSGFTLAIGSVLFAATPRHIVDDDAFTKSATDAAAQLQKDGKLVKLETLLAQPPSKEPVKFAAPAAGPVAPTELYSRLRAGTVAVGALYECHDCSKWHVNLATGFVVAEDGIVSTCAHVFAYDDEEMKDAYAITVDAGAGTSDTLVGTSLGDTFTITTLDNGSVQYTGSGPPSFFGKTRKSSRPIMWSA